MSIPIHLVTGFLGSGKSSFLTHFLKGINNTGKIAIIQNEFSPVNIDGRKLLQTNEYDILEINNGSVFCVCLLGSFIDSLSTFIENVKPDVLLMETSGLSDTIGVGQVFQAEKLKGKVYLEHTWCLVDAQNYNRIPSLKQRFQHQLRSADTIIINKIDLAETPIDTIITEIKEYNPFAGIVQAQYGQVELTNKKKALNLFPANNEKSMGRPDIESVVIRSSWKISRKNLMKFLTCHESIRAKGFIILDDNKTVFLQGVFGSFNIEEVSNISGPTEFVMIGNFKQKENIQILYEEYCRK
ncbi:CobW family GTP-binding protein [Sunxiuqinia sp. A32]|uniref:CobW family GTP-binding protein n=1 Tax=Sunxiuqinia sp. A32 TaxID=3461496 RepID=UPI0040455B28